MSIETDYATLRKVLADSIAGRGWAVEFGVYSGYSLAIIAAHMPVVGFDSFEGLPEDWRPGFPKGMFGDTQDTPWKPPYNSMLVRGWFEDTVPTFPFPDLSLVHIDCDLYSSTVTALDAVTPFVDVGTILVFDEFHSYPGAAEHEEKAFWEWKMKHQITTELLVWGEGEHAQEAAFIIHDIGEQ